MVVQVDRQTCSCDVSVSVGAGRAGHVGPRGLQKRDTDCRTFLEAPSALSAHHPRAHDASAVRIAQRVEWARC